MGKYDFPGPEDDAMVSRVKDAITGVLKAGTTDLAGSGVDIISTVLRAAGVPVTDKPIGGSKNLRELLGQNAEDRSVAETIGTLVNPENAAKAMIIGAARIPSRFEARSKYISNSLKGDGNIPESELLNYTGTFMDKDRIAKTFITDKSAYIKDETAKTLSEFLDHPTLYKLYPELKSIPIIREGRPNTGSMMTDNSKMSIGPGTSADRILELVLHETQHAVQHIEDFGRGGQASNFLSFNLNTVKDSLARAAKSADTSVREAATRFRMSVNEKITEANNRYLNLPGEQEARYTAESAKLDTTQLGSDLMALLRKGDTPQTYDTRPIRAVQEKQPGWLSGTNTPTGSGK